MCGIAGIIQKKNNSTENIQKFVASCKLMNHRGPDFMGIESFGNITIVHLRLSIIDIDNRSNQPFKSNCGNFICTYNGEIYNYNDLKKSINHNWRTNSDTEVMLELFAKYKISCVKSWNGIFATGILDKKSNEFYLIRDRLGIKPLYFYEDEHAILFASEAKVILNYLSDFSINYQALHQFIWFGNTTGLQTVINGLTKIEPATVTRINLSDFGKQTEKYWNYQDIQTTEINEESATEQLRTNLKKSIKNQLIADVPLGILLSGGVDSSGLVAFAALNSSAKIDTYSIDYDYNIGGKSELAKAKLIAEKYQTNHHELRVTTKDVSNIFKALVFQFDEPFADPATIPLYQLAKACSTDKRVILQGDGGDELFGGYSRYNVINSFYFWKVASNIYRLMPRGRKKERLERLSFILNQNNHANLISFYLSVETPYKDPLMILNQDFSNKLKSTLWNNDYILKINKYKNKTLLEKLLLVDFDILLTNRYLEKVDKATMLCSIEARVPYLDNEMVDFALSLPVNLKIKGKEKKYILKKALQDLVPEEILYGRKRGFDMPYKHWLRNDLYEFALDSIKSIDNSIINHQVFEDRLNLHKQYKADFGDLLWKMLILANWLKIYQSKLSY
jgi:asparagine synthase (glutamine-hydrolysing)